MADSNSYGAIADVVATGVPWMEDRLQCNLDIAECCSKRSHYSHDFISLTPGRASKLTTSPILLLEIVPERRSYPSGSRTPAEYHGYHLGVLHEPESWEWGYAASPRDFQDSLFLLPCGYLQSFYLD